MATRVLSIARHGMADAFGELTDTGRQQASLLGQRLARVPVSALWHSPLPRAAGSAQEIARHLPNVPVAEAGELVEPSIVMFNDMSHLPNELRWTGFPPGGRP